MESGSLAIIGIIVTVSAFFGQMWWPEGWRRDITISTRIRPNTASIAPNVFIGLQPDQRVSLNTAKASTIENVGFMTCDLPFFFWQFRERRIDARPDIRNPILPQTTSPGQRLEFFFQPFPNQLRDATFICAFVEYNDQEIRRSKYRLIRRDTLNVDMSRSFGSGNDNIEQ